MKKMKKVISILLILTFVVSVAACGGGGQTADNGEYITVTRRGTIENAGGYSKYTIRISGNYYLCEIPTTKKNGKDFSIMEDALGSKASRGNICLAHDASTDGGINAEWIWNITEENKKIKVLVFDDKDRSLVPAGSK